MLDREYYDKHGKVTTEQKQECARIVSRQIGDGALGAKKLVTKYFVKYCGYLYDPVQMNEIDARYRNWQMREVSKSIFDTYLQFLQTRKEHFKNNAERLINAQAN